ncbi:hypothetical protein B0H14DRAFT_2626195 [Mycena olivaceomarginata]|nr:hypothetical protein B0H14DRAFT_2626195 [Mycena olivaceomarginata]
MESYPGASTTNSLIQIEGGEALPADDFHMMRRGAGLSMFQFSALAAEHLKWVVEKFAANPARCKLRIEEFFGDHDGREEALDELHDNQNGLSRRLRELQRPCDRLAEFTRPKSTTIDTQLIAFKVLVAVITRYPGLRRQLQTHRDLKKTSENYPSLNSLWNRPDQFCGDEWNFYRSPHPPLNRPCCTMSTDMQQSGGDSNPIESVSELPQGNSHALCPPSTSALHWVPAALSHLCRVLHIHVTRAHSITLRPIIPRPAYRTEWISSPALTGLWYSSTGSVFSASEVHKIWIHGLPRHVRPPYVYVGHCRSYVSRRAITFSGPLRGGSSHHCALEDVSEHKQRPPGLRRTVLLLEQMAIGQDVADGKAGNFRCMTQSKYRANVEIIGPKQPWIP